MIGGIYTRTQADEVEIGKTDVIEVRISTTNHHIRLCIHQKLGNVVDQKIRNDSKEEGLA